MKNSKLSLKRLLFVLATLSVCSGVGAEPVTVTDPYDSEWCFVIASEGAGTIKTSIDNGTFKFKDYVDRNGTRITGQLNQDDITALASLTYPANYPTYLDLKAVTFSGEVTLTLNSLFKGLRLPQNSDFSIVPQSVDFAYYSDYTKINYNDGHNESIPIYLYVNEGGMASAISKLGDYLAYRTIYLSGSFTDSEKESLVNAKNGITIGNSGGSSGGEGGESGGGGDTPVDQTTLADKIAKKMQLTDVPTIYITLPDIGETTLDNYLYKTCKKGETYDDAPYRRARIKVVATDDTTSPHYMESFEVDEDHLEIKARGNSTALENVTDAKRAYRLKFAKKDKTTGIDYKHDMINGGYSKRNWTLLANLFDHSLIRNALTCELGKIVGMPFTPGYKFVDLVINDEYRGTYQVSDHPEVDSKRININEDTGWYVEFQGKPQMCDFPMFISKDGLTYNINNPEPAYTGTETNRADSLAVENILKNEMQDWFKNSWIKGFNTGFTSPTTGWRAYNDEETLMKFWIITEITGDYDGLMSVKAYREADGKLCWGPVWDKDLAYGNYSTMVNPKGTLVKDMSGNGSSVQGYFINNFAKDPAFMAKVKAKMDELVEGGLKTTLCNKVDYLAGLVAQTEAMNETRWVNQYTNKQFCENGTGLEYYRGDKEGYDNYAAYVAQLKEWINDRVDFVQAQINSLYEAVNPATPTAWTYDVTSEAGNTSYTKDELRSVTMTNRTLTANQWNAVSFPFDINNAMMKSVFGEDFELKEFSGVDESDGTSLLFTTPADKAIVAGYPYLLKPSKAVNASPLFSSVIPSVSVGYFNNALSNGSVVTYGDYSFSAHLFKSNLKTDGTYKLVGADGILSNPEKVNDWDTQVGVNGCMAYIHIPSSAEAPTITFPEAVEPVVRTQLTNLPTIYIDTQDGTPIQPSTEDYVQAAIEVMDANGKLTPFVETSEFLQVRGRGKTEWDVENGKKSYRLKFAKKHKYDLTGAGYTKRNWVLAANAADESMIKNALTKKLGDKLEMSFTPNCCFVDLVVNGEYMGTYTAMDFVEADRENDVSRRVNADEKTGWLLELTNEDGIDKSGDVYLAGTDYTKPWVNIKNPEPDYADTDTEEVKDAAISAVISPIQSFIDNLWISTQTSVDRGSLVNWYIASEILGGTQTLSSVYAYKDAGDTQLKFGPLWGNELSYQNAGMTDLENSETATGLIVNSASESALRNKLKDLWGSAWFSSAVTARWAVVKVGLADALKNEADELKGVISTSWTKNFTEKASDGAGWTATSTLDSNVDAIKTYIDNRIAYLDRKFALLAANSAVEGDVNGDGLVDNADVVTLLLHTLGKTPTGFVEENADVNNDGNVDNADVVTLLHQTLTNN